MGEQVKFSLAGDVAIITLNEPPLNLFADLFIEDLDAAVDQMLKSTCRSALIHAAGPNFSAGANAEIFVNTSAARAREMFSKYVPIIHKLEAAPIPILAAVHGFCLAAGLELALACDMIFAAQNTQFSQVEALIGATTFLGGAQRLALRCGDARAREIVFTADVYTAATFEQWNIVNRVLPDETLYAESLKFAERLAAGPTKAHAVTKKMLRELCDHGIRDADAVIISDSVALFESEDLRAGSKVVIEKGARSIRTNRAAFKGR